MTDYVTKIRTTSGDKQIDYNALANLPKINGESIVGDKLVAPAEFGLGEAVGTGTALGDANTAVRCGWYRVHANTLNCVGYAGVMRVDGYSSTHAVQTVYQVNRTDYAPTMQRVCLNGIWGEWSWVNPPLHSGNEYRTTRLSDGKPVYVKSFRFGDGAAAGTTKTITHGITGIATALGVKVIDASGTITEAATFLQFTKTDITISLPSNVGGKALYITCEYTKE